MRTRKTRFVEIDPKKCEACWECVDACPRGIIGRVRFLWHRHIVITALEACVGCGKCVRACRHGVFTKIG